MTYGSESECAIHYATAPPQRPTARADNYRRVVASPSSIQLARERLRRPFEETEAVNRVDSVMASRSRFQARTGGSESVIKCKPCKTHFLNSLKFVISDNCQNS